MRLTNGKLFFLCCVVIVFVVGYARGQIAELYHSISSRLSSTKENTEVSAAPSSDTAADEQEGIGAAPENQPPIVTEVARTPPPTSAPHRTGDIGVALEGVGPGGLDKNLVNQRQEYLKNLNAQLLEQHGGEIPTTTSTTLRRGFTPPPVIDESAQPPSPDLIPQNIHPDVAPGVNPEGWVEPPPMLQQTNPSIIGDEDEDISDDEDLETDEGDDTESDDDSDDSSDDEVE